MRSEFLSLNASAAIVKAANIIRVTSPNAHICSSASHKELARVSDVFHLESYLVGKEPVTEFDGLAVGRTVYWLDLLDKSPLNPPMAYIRGVHFSTDGMELGESDIFEVRD